jgi:hypothetical protein
MNLFSRRVVCSLFVLSTILVSSQAITAQKITLEDLVSKHRASIGTKQALASVKARMAMGLSEFESKLPSRKATGKAVITSRGEDFMFLVSLLSQEYPFEKIGYFGNRISLPFVTAGTRSPLGAFVAEHEKMLTTGVFTGAMSGAWPLLQDGMNEARTKLAGTRKVNDRDAYVLEFWPKGMDSAEFTILLFFDAENFRHVRTEYRHTINPWQDTFGKLGRQGGLRQSLVESFGDFKTVAGLTLPYGYDAHYTTESADGTYEYFWRLKLTQYLLNPNLDANFFTFDVGKRPRA